ncbi:hypothetical protein HPB48_020525 [Haemaphysalis longicornis]|uniref:Uncharacterized protein n=1 Tax=Haemaphysalis longicornis TaxID=44386 RepID=A0A9J6G5Z9_HAELO|nr:hypothetical protein HPB48_020525 [Haemaphysalis longicornis]
MVSTCDTKEAARLLRMQLLRIRSRAPLPIKVPQVTARGNSCEVIYGCRASETSETLAKALVSDGVKILMATPMGKNDTVLINFAAPKPP